MTAKVNELNETIVREVALQHKEEISEVLFNTFLEKVCSYVDNNKINDYETSIYIKASEILKEVGVPASIRGYNYLREAIILCCTEKEKYFGNVTTELYPQISKKYATTSSRVERAIRHAIEVAYTRGNIEIIEKMFGYTINSCKGKPTNSEFIFMIVDILEVKEMSK